MLTRTYCGLAPKCFPPRVRILWPLKKLSQSSTPFRHFSHAKAAKLRLQVLPVELAECRRKLRQAEPPAAVHRPAKLLPPLCHKAVASLEERLAILRAASLLAAVCHCFKHLGSSELRVFGHADGVELDEFGHPPCNFEVFDQSPPEGAKGRVKEWLKRKRANELH